MNVRPCKSCGVPIFDAPHVFTGRLAPIEVAPVADGNVKLHETGHYSIIRGPVNLPVRYRSHFAVCPAATAHRRPRCAA